jgi:hypothetical protein
MLPCRLFGTCTALAAVALLTAAFATQEKGKEGKPKPASAPAAGSAAPGMDPEMMANMTKFMTPGPEHKILDACVGKWTTHVKMWMDPAAPVMESEGSAEGKWIMDGRYLQEDFKSTMMGKPFEGMGVTGFDNIKKAYVGSWIDNMGTGVTSMEGTYDAAKKTISCTSQSPDATWTKYVPARMVSTLVDANTHKLEMYGPDKSGKEFRCMEITYTRAK